MYHVVFSSGKGLGSQLLELLLAGAFSPQLLQELLQLQRLPQSRAHPTRTAHTHDDHGGHLGPAPGNSEGPRMSAKAVIGPELQLSPLPTLASVPHLSLHRC